MEEPMSWPEFFRALGRDINAEVEHSAVQYNPQRLLDITARAVGKHMEPCDIVSCQPPLDEALYKKVLHYVFPESISAALFMKTLYTDGDIHVQAKHLIENGNLKTIKQVGFLLVAQFKVSVETRDDNTLPFRSSQEDIRVSVEFAKQRITSVKCSKCTDTSACVHAYAAIMHRINSADSVKIFPPLTESLCLMDRDKLQRLVHKVVSKNSAYLVELLYNSLDEMKSEDEGGGDIQDPTVSDGGTTVSMVESAIGEHLRHLIRTNDELFSGYDWDGRHYRLKDVFQKAVNLSKEYPSATLALQYLDRVGYAARHYRVKGCAGKRDRCSARLFLRDMMLKGGTIFPRRNNPVTVHNIDVEKWKHFLQESHIGCAADDTPTHILKSSKWVEFPRLYPLYKDNIEQVFGLKEEDIAKGYFGEAIASLFIPPPPPEYEALIKGKEGPLESTYNEPLAVMMARAGAYDYDLDDIPSQKDKANFVKEQMRIMDKIIIKLSQMGLKYSILSLFGKRAKLGDYCRIEIGNAERVKDKPFLKFIMENSKGMRLTKKVTPKSDKSNQNPLGRSSIKENDDPNSTSNTKNTNTSTGTRKRKSSLVLSSANSPKRSDHGDCSSPEKFVPRTRDGHKIPRGLVVPDYIVTEIDFENYLELYEQTVYPKFDIAENETFISADSKSPGEGLIKEQLAYSLMYWLLQRQQIVQLYQLIFSEDPVTSNMKDIIQGTHAIALELSRYRLTTKRNDLYRKELEYLSSLENRIIISIDIDAFSHTYQRWLYISAWHHLGFDFYGRNIPATIGNYIFKWALLDDSKVYTAFFGTTKVPEDIFRLVLCDVILLETKDTYTFTSRPSGQYRALESKKALRLPTYQPYYSFMAHFIDLKLPKRFRLNEVWKKMMQVSNKIFSSPVKMLSYGMWSILKDFLKHFGSEKKENMLMLRLSLHLCDLFPKPSSVRLKSIKSIESAIKVLGPECLSMLKKHMGNGNWRRYFRWDDMERILFKMSADVKPKPTMQPEFYSFLLDILQYNFDHLYGRPSDYENAMRFSNRWSTFLGVKTSSTRTNLLAFAAKRLISSKSAPACELAMKALIQVLNYMRKDPCDPTCRSQIVPIIRDGNFSDQQIEQLVLTIVDMERCPTQVVFALLDKLKVPVENCQNALFNSKLSLWLVRNINCEILEKFTVKEHRNISEVFAYIKDKYDLYIKHVHGEEMLKRDRFKQMVENVEVRIRIQFTRQMKEMLQL